MKKHRNSNRSQKQKAKSAADGNGPTDKSRRRFLGFTRNGAIAVVAAGGAGFLLVEHVRGTMREHDFSRIGNGTPTVVQIHDPQCSMCLALQRETRKALGQFNDSEIDYVVANIRSADGKRLANQYRVPHVTLLLFDGDGVRQATLTGQRKSRELAVAFRHILPK